jgi:carboxyl-terminal processing protease
MVQLPKELGALKVTTALFFRPGGSSTQHEGVSADIVFPSIYSANELGEKHQDYSLPGQSIDAFLEQSSTPSPGVSESDLWRPVTKDAVASLADRSAKRVEQSEEFAKIRKQIEEATERNGVLHLSDIYKPPQPEGAEAGTDPASGGSSGGGLPGDGSVASTQGDSESGSLAAIPPRPTDAEGPSEEDEPTPQQQEALRILADWVMHHG